MANNFCNKCGYDLFIKTVLEDSYAYWCPYCLNLRPLDKNEALYLCEKYVELTQLQSIKYCQNFSTESLICFKFSTNKAFLSMLFMTSEFTMIGFLASPFFYLHCFLSFVSSAHKHNRLVIYLKYKLQVY